MKKVSLWFKKVFSNNTISAALDNVLAMFPSTVLMPILINTSLGYEAFDVSKILLLTGVSTIIFLMFTKGRLPGYLGSSFAFIGVSTYIATLVSKSVTSREEILAYIIGGYICSAGYLLLLSLICLIGKKSNNYNPMKVINKIIPPAVMGPAISLIGLELSGQAIEQSGLNSGFNTNSAVALATIILVIGLSVTRRPIFKKSSILLGVGIISAWTIYSGYWDITPVLESGILHVPKFGFVMPKFSLPVAVLTLPPTIVLFCDHIGRKITIESMQQSLYDDKITNDIPKSIQLAHSVGGNALANAASAIFGGVPLTIYAENVAVMRINNDTRVFQFYIASIVAIILSFSGNLLQLIMSIPEPILGGLSLVLMGIIASPGIKMLIDENVDYSKITNLFLTAAVLITGISEMSISIVGTELKGMSLGLVVGIGLNLIFGLFKMFNLSKEHLTFTDVKTYCESLRGAMSMPPMILIDQEGVHKFLITLSDNYKNLNNSYLDKESLNKFEFLQLSMWHDQVRIAVRTNESIESIELKYNTTKIADGWMTLTIDGTVKDKEIKRLIAESHSIVCSEIYPYGLS